MCRIKLYKIKDTNIKGGPIGGQNLWKRGGDKDRVIGVEYD
jgi:hypothetical protein